MSDRLRVLPWIGGGTRDFPNAAISPLVSPVDESVVADMVDADAAAVDAAVTNAHAAFVANQEAPTSRRVEWLMAAADAADKIEAAVRQNAGLIAEQILAGEREEGDDDGEEAAAEE